MASNLYCVNCIIIILVQGFLELIFGVKKFYPTYAGKTVMQEKNVWTIMFVTCDAEKDPALEKIAATIFYKMCSSILLILV